MILSALVKKEAREIIRDPVTLGVAVLLPLVMLLLFGYAISLDVEDVSLAVYDLDKTQESVRFTEAFTSSGYFNLNYDLRSFDEVDEAMDSGRAAIVLVLPEGFSRDLASGARSTVQVIIDGTFSATALVVANYASSIINSYSNELVKRRLERLGVSPPPSLAVTSRVWYNPPMKSVNYIVPGLFAVLLMAFPPMLTALAIVKEKERGTIEQIYVSPIRPPLFILGKIIPYAAVAFAEMLLILGVGTFWFEVPFRGSILVLVAMSVIYSLCTVGIGVFVSTITRTQLAAMLLSLVITLMPSFLFSGFLFPIATMPYALQLYTYVFPARYFNDISRDIFLKGAGLEYLWWNMTLLVTYTAVLFALASFRFRKKVA